MKKIYSIMRASSTRATVLGSAATLVLSLIFAPEMNAAPYASGVTNNNGTIEFILNEDGGDVNVVFEDHTTNAMGVLAKGHQSFPLGTHTSYSIRVTKLGNGTPFKITSDADQFSIWNSPRGVDINKNPKIGYLFGRTYVGNSAAGGTAPNNKGHGLYALNADLSDSPLGHGATASTSSIWANSGSSGPYRLTVAPDNSVYVTDYSTAGGGLWQFDPNFNSYSNLVLSPVGENEGIAAKTHGDPIGVFVSGSIATGDLVVYTADPGLGVPATTQVGDNTHPGDYNILYRYDIGSGPLPWGNSPNFGVSLGLQGFFDSQILDVTVGQGGKLYGMFRRDNLSNGDIQVFDPQGHQLYTSLHDGNDVFKTGSVPNGTGAYAGVRISPDGRFLATATINNEIKVCYLVDGIPDESTLITIPNTPSTGNSRGIAFDAADNVYVCSSGQGLLRGYSLGLSTTAITSNDSTGTNGTFELSLPLTTATVAATTPTASQNYINSPTPGTPIPGVFTISLNTNHLDAPVIVAYALNGSAAYLSNYTLNTNNTLNGVVVTSTNVIFPAGDFPGGGNWTQDIQVIPTATPLTGPTLNVGIRISGGANYVASAPVSASLSILNTGPQLLVLSAAPAALGATMNRGIAGDYAHFIITRQGDLNGPGNSAGNVSPTTYTVTNFILGGTAVFPADYTAGPQNKTAPGTEVPAVGNPGIVINPGDVIITNIIGNPVAHTDLTAAPTNATIILQLGTGTATNLTSAEGLAYSVSNNAVTLTELDNTVGPETILWSNPLTDASDSTNWTLTFASTNLGATTRLPVVVTNYGNVAPDPSDNGGSNNFEVTFGYPVALDAISPSPVMLANGWTNVLKMTVNKDPSFPAPAGVNLYPQGRNFSGNYALRFQMYLSIYAFAIDNPNPGSFPNEFAIFGLNNKGTNCNWKPTTPVTVATGGSGMTNSDGIWVAVNAGAGSLTPADYDAFVAPPLPNSGPLEPVSNTAASQAGVFKHPPFVAQATSAGLLGGSPINKWVDVSLEVTGQTNVSLFIDRAQVLATFVNTNSTNGTIMLGYLDPVASTGDRNSQFVYYSNLRVVGLPSAPSLATVSPATQSVLWGSTIAFTVSATGTEPFTYQWKKDGTDITGATNATITLTNITSAAGGSYTVALTNSVGGVISSPGTLTVLIPPPTFTPGGLSFVGTNVVMSFSTSNGHDSVNAFTLQSSPVVEGPYTNTPASFTAPGDGTFQVTTPATSGNMFYRLVHSN